MNFLQKFIYIIRFIYNIPLRIIFLIGNLYSDLLNIMDKKNHDSFWEEILQKRVGQKISKPIKISNNQEIQFYIPSLISAYRAKTFFSKEPDTIDWIKKKGGADKILYDVGANMGIYSIYYAKMFKSNVYAFEPSFKNLDLLVKNINLNLLADKVHAISNPLSKNFIFSNFFQIKSSPGFAGATFNDNLVKKNMITKDTNWSTESLEYNTLGLSIDNLTALNLIKKPDLLKIDVDGNELDVIEGCRKTIEQSNTISILIETRQETEMNIKKEFEILGLKKSNKSRNNEIWEK
jgi:FkbM family methyltransferase